MSLLETQRAFATALLDEASDAIWRHIAEDGFSAAERLRIYRNTCRSTLVETLRMSYPAVDRLVGCEFFEVAAGRYAAAHPARSGYLNDYGGEFGAFLAGFEPARELVYLADVARYEWALSIAANAEDAPVLHPAALQRICAEQHAELRFAAHPSVSFLELAYPADEIADAVLAGDEAAMAEIDLASGPIRIIVHRGPGGLETERVTACAAEFVRRLYAGATLGHAVEAAPGEAAILLARELTNGRLSGYRLRA